MAPPTAEIVAATPGRLDGHQRRRHRRAADRQHAVRISPISPDSPDVGRGRRPVGRRRNGAGRQRDMPRPPAPALREVPDAAVLTVVHGQSYDEAIAALVSGSRMGHRRRGGRSHDTSAGQRACGGSAANPGAAGSTTDGVIERLRPSRTPGNRPSFARPAGRLSAVAKCILPEGLTLDSRAPDGGAVDVALRRAASKARRLIPSSPPDRTPPGRITAPATAGSNRVSWCSSTSAGCCEGYAADMSRTLGLGPHRPAADSTGWTP